MPAYFNEAQRCSTEIAAKLAGFNVLGILSEPVAAAIAMCYDRQLTNDTNILVYDFGMYDDLVYDDLVDVLYGFVLTYFCVGGGTFDTAVVSINVHGTCNVLATNGNTKLGGAKFVDLLMEHFVKELSIDINLFNEKELAYIRTASEKAKIDLSTAEETEIVVFDER